MPPTFVSDDSGAVTVDWVVLTAALVGLGLAAMSVVSSGVEDVSGDIDGALHDNTIIKTSFVQDPDVYALLLATYTDIGMAEYADTFFGEFEGEMAQDTDALTATYTAAQAEAQFVTDILEVASQQFADTGTLDFAELETLYVAAGKPEITAEIMQTTLDSLYDSDPSRYVASMEMAKAQEDAMLYHFKAELQRRGELPQN